MAMKQITTETKLKTFRCRNDEGLRVLVPEGLCVAVPRGDRMFFHHIALAPAYDRMEWTKMLRCPLCDYPLEEESS